MLLIFYTEEPVSNKNVNYYRGVPTYIDPKY